MRPDLPALSLARLAVLVWSGVVGFVCVRAAIQPSKHTVYPIFARAGGHWLSGKNLYFPDLSEPFLDPYRYSPLVAAALVPFHSLPDEIGGILWRLLNAAAFLAAWAWWLRSAAPISLTERQIAWLFLLVVPLALNSLNNGQANLLVTGLLLATVTAACHQRWWAAASFMAVATALKVYPLALGLLIAAVYPRRFTPRLFVALAVAALLPFALQRAHFVLQQYQDWFTFLGQDDRKGRELNLAYRDLWLLFRVWQVPVASGVYLTIQLGVAAFCALLCVAGRLRGWSARPLLTTTLTLGTCWMTLCGPATESCSYVILAPALAWALVAGRDAGWTTPVRALSWGCFGLLVAALLAGIGPGAARFHALGPQPLGALLLFAGYLLVTAQAVAARQSVTSREVPTSEAWAA
jgi:hypothetical protein